MCTGPEAQGHWFCEPQKKNIHNETFKQKIYIVLLDFLNISTPVVKDDYSPRKLLTNKKIEKITFLVFLCTWYIYITYIKRFAK